MVVFERNIAKNGQFYFNLKSGNGQVIGTSEMYKATAGRDNGIESVKKNGPEAEINYLFHCSQISKKFNMTNAELLKSNAATLVKGLRPGLKLKLVIDNNQSAS